MLITGLGNFIPNHFKGITNNMTARISLLYPLLKYNIYLFSLQHSRAPEKNHYGKPKSFPEKLTYFYEIA